jgi:type I restriction enzyme R subunit
LNKLKFTFWAVEQERAFLQPVDEEKLSKGRTQALINNYMYSEQKPMRDEILGLLDSERPTLLQRKKIGDRILSKIIGFIETFINAKAG